VVAEEHSMSAELRSRAGRIIRSPSGLALLAFLAIAGFYLMTEHTAHLVGVLPYALLLLCPLLHLFMHGGHGGRDGHDGPAGDHAGHGESRLQPPAGAGR
jgi:hypothetical protein